ncbi:hypothetical protein B0J12DRAFT_687381 [Macrophomina phaseolina]|uniref:Uncharacterized protein n=1 Tax=Macrophomina phaseolina TaxID=35725 RepID=A0ABQ8FSD0_9PEZI|nr:hypothetical protein B0J12DRAFT_687381 [Macrophomina phaseolina]
MLDFGVSLGVTSGFASPASASGSFGFVNIILDTGISRLTSMLFPSSLKTTMLWIRWPFLRGSLIFPKAAPIPRLPMPARRLTFLCDLMQRKSLPLRCQQYQISSLNTRKLNNSVAKSIKPPAVSVTLRCRLSGLRLCLNSMRLSNSSPSPFRHSTHWERRTSLCRVRGPSNTPTTLSIS